MDDLVPPAASVRGLRKVFRRTVALDSVDLDLPTGSILGLLGPNGSGKTTMLRLLLGLSRPTEGSVRLLGEPMPQRSSAALPHVGALVEGPGFHRHLSGRANLTRCADAEPLLCTPEVPGAVREALHRVGLDDSAADRRYGGYSLGMRQRLALAAVLLVPRRLVVLDEPTNGLDPAGTRDVRRIIGELHRAGATVLLSSHLLTEVEETCTHVAILAEGSVMATGGLDALLESEGPALAIDVRDGTDRTAALTVLRSAGILGYLDHGRLVAGLADTTPDEVLRLLVHAGVPVTEAHRRRTGLEELFVRLTEEST
ncbi:ABC transporter ATP-binding protein [Pseudonocardia spinosispora]|uniref:ABC transporter ATP-binding protein n=1 Tax=Pseudonocardia spinosispora TaxID=103441 RepID=UPI000685265E|nr:ABC transporter ATP-binding protein [Pseudonocardia spinosispora]